jgi:thiaminase/transcriptional activator TenA
MGMAWRFDDLKQRCAGSWEAYCHHEFVRRLGTGDLPQAAFRHYLQQDYLFLIHFARAFALAAYKSRSLADLRRAGDGLKAILDIELDLHVAYCSEWGIPQDDLEALPESRATLAYTRYVLDTGNRGDLLDLHVALSPCMIGYAEIAAWLLDQPSTRLDGNPYAAWISMYAGDEFQLAARDERDWVDARLARVDAARFDGLVEIFDTAARLEADFWQMGLDLAD